MTQPNDTPSGLSEGPTQQDEGWTEKSASPSQQREPEPSRDATGWEAFGGSPADFHRERAANASPFWYCRACGVARFFHNTDGHTSHWFVP